MKWYRQAMHLLLNKEIDFDSDALTWTLHTSAYTPNLDTHVHVSDLTNELASANGYTAGGILATGLTRVYTAANSWGVVRANSTAYLVDDVVIPSGANGFLYRATTSGSSGGAPPAFPTVLGQTVVDGGVTWECAGSGIEVFQSAAANWAGAGFTARYLVLSDRTAALAANQPLIGIEDFGNSLTGGGGNFTVSWPNNSGSPLGGLYLLIP